MSEKLTLSCSTALINVKFKGCEWLPVQIASSQKSSPKRRQNYSNFNFKFKIKYYETCIILSCHFPCSPSPLSADTFYQLTLRF